jgi:tetratricopeptide (TPR) repeat protein
VLITMPLFAHSVTRQALTAVTGLGDEVCMAAITRLVRMNILNVDYIGLRYSIHPMTRAFAEKNLRAQSSYRDAAQHRCCEFYLQFAREHVLREQPPLPYWNALVTDRMTAIDVEWASILGVLAYADDHREDALLLELVMILVHFMDSRFYNLERMSYVRKAIDVAERLGRREVEALLRIDALGWTYVEENRLEEAEVQIRRGLALAETLKWDPRVEPRSAEDLIALGNAWLGRLTIEHGDAETAERLVEIAMATPCSPWIRYRVFMAAGDIALKIGDSSRAITAYQSALAEYDSYGGEGQGYQIDPRLGMAYASSGDLTRATEKFEGLRARPQIAIGRLYGDYGAAYVAYRQGRIDEARSLASAARTELSRSTSSNLLLEMIDKLFDDLEHQT